MLAIFNKSVAKSPEDLKNTSDVKYAAGINALDHFSSTFSENVFVKLNENPCCLAFSYKNPNPFLGRTFSVLKGIYCMFQGCIHNFGEMQRRYGLSRHVDEAILMTEAYRTIRDRQLSTTDKILKEFRGAFAFVIYDSKCKVVFAAADADSNVPFYWGVDSCDCCIFCNDLETIRKGCENSYAQFPKGHFFTSVMGLQWFSDKRVR